MAIYYPEMFCEVGSILKVKNAFDVELENAAIAHLLQKVN